jgi:hypothetical protein
VKGWLPVQLSAKVDPELIRQIDTGSASSDPLEAVFMLRSENPAEIVSEPEATTELAKNVLDRVTHRTGIEPETVNVFENLGSFVVVAQPRFIRTLTQQPEIASAVANRRPERAFIPPVSKRPASISEIGNEERQIGSSGRSLKRPTARKRTLK